MLIDKQRKFLSLLLVVIMSYHIIGSMTFLFIGNFFHKHQMQALLHSTEISELKISNSLLRNHSGVFIRLNEQEIFYQGNYYDASFEKSEKEFSYFKVIKDQDEKTWHRQLKRAEARSNENPCTGKTAKANSKIFSPECFATSRFEIFCNHSQFCFRNNHLNSVSSFIQEIIIPPPQFS